jgi:hypothetical protein
MSLDTILLMLLAYCAGGASASAAIHFGVRLQEARADGRFNGGGES